MLSKQEWSCSSPAISQVKGIKVGNTLGHMPSMAHVLAGLPKHVQTNSCYHALPFHMLQCLTLSTWLATARNQ